MLCVKPTILFAYYTKQDRANKENSLTNEPTFNKKMMRILLLFISIRLWASVSFVWHFTPGMGGWPDLR